MVESEYLDAVRTEDRRDDQAALIAAVIGPRPIPESGALGDGEGDEFGSGFLSLEVDDGVKLGPDVDGVGA